MNEKHKVPYVGGQNDTFRASKQPIIIKSKTARGM